MKCIVNTTENWGIGKGNQLLVHIPEDMKWFRIQTTDKIVIMGRKTLESFPGKKPLKNRVNIVITKNKDYVPEKNDNSIVIIVKSPGEAVEAALEFIKIKNGIEKNDEEKMSDSDIFVIGGASIYEQLMPYVDEAYVTRVYTTVPADTFFPNLDEDPMWEIEGQTEEKEHEGIRYNFVIYKKITAQKD